MYVVIELAVTEHGRSMGMTCTVCVVVSVSQLRTANSTNAFMLIGQPLFFMGRLWK